MALDLAFDGAMLAYSEIALKGGRVRGRLERLLASQVAAHLKKFHMKPYAIIREEGRIYVKSNEAEPIARRACKLFGIEFAASVLESPTHLDAIVGRALELAEVKFSHGEKFAVKARRTGPHPYRSKDIEEKVGAALLEALKAKRIRVNLTQPTQTLFIEARANRAYLYSSVDVFRGPGGLPYGCEGQAVALVDCSNHGLVAAWLVMRRGVRVDFLHLAIDEEEDSPCEGKLKEGIKALLRFIPRPFVNLTVARCGEPWRLEGLEDGALRRALAYRLRLRVASLLASSRGALGIVTGESTFYLPGENWARLRMSLASDACNHLIFRPLLAMEKEEVQILEERLGLEPCRKTETEAWEVGPVSGPDFLEKVRRCEETLRLEAMAETAFRNAERKRVYA